MTNLMRESSEGEVSRHAHAATLLPDRFYCLLDELPLHLIPRPAFKSFKRCDASEQTLFLNPECIICSAGELPEELELERERLTGFALEATIAWVRDSATGSLLPFWLGPQLEDAVRKLERGEPVPRTLQGDARRWLSAAGILTPADYETRRLREWRDAVEKSGPVFRVKGYAPIADLIHPFHVGALRRYYRHLIRTGAIQLGDGQSPWRYVAYNEPVARFFHQQITATLSAVAGEPLKPSYVYLASYLSGAELKKHTDREQCEFSVTLCLDFSPEPALETPWPITAGHCREVRQRCIRLWAMRWRTAGLACRITGIV